MKRYIAISRFREAERFIGKTPAADNQPDFRTISVFRLKHGEALAGLFEQSVRLCQKAGMVSLGQVAVDGTKLSANAGKHKAMSYGRLVPAEELLTKEIADYRKRCSELDAEEDALFGREASGPSVAEELKRREGRLARIRAARAAIEAEARCGVAGSKRMACRPISCSQT